MAHFAEIKESNNEVVRVLVFSNEDVNAHGGDLSTEAEEWVKTSTPRSVDEPVYWKQTSYNNNFRKKYAGPNMIYNSSLDMFVGAEPGGPGWTLDSNGDWQPGSTYPTELEYEVDPSTIMPIQIYWDEDSSTWKGVKKKLNDTILTWNSATGVWE
jgi:hypothetical protein|tara:strand:- start:107 stop:571 length:465 start_codon:yes stop_codon:yes gene_type:complete